MDEAPSGNLPNPKTHLAAACPQDYFNWLCGHCRGQFYDRDYRWHAGEDILVRRQPIVCWLTSAETITTAMCIKSRKGKRTVFGCCLFLDLRYVHVAFRWLTTCRRCLDGCPHYRCSIGQHNLTDQFPGTLNLSCCCNSLPYE